MKNKIIILYESLLLKYNPQGWWPLLDLHDSKIGSNPTKTGSIRGYHPKDYSYPKTEKQKFEICIGAILTQNTSWPNVEKALMNLKKKDLIDAKKLSKISQTKLSLLIKPSGYFNQKSKKLIIFSKFYQSLNGKTPSREELLSVWGIGLETADSILLYAYKVPTFVVDAYTRRTLSSMNLMKDYMTYDEIKLLFEKNIKKDYRIYQEYHALIVENEKRIKPRIKK